MLNPKPDLENETNKLFRDFEIQTTHLISVRWLNPVIVNNKKWTCRIVDFAVPAEHRVKLKESEKKGKYLNLARELKKKLWNIKVTVIPIIIGALGTVTKGSVHGLKELEIRDETNRNHLNYCIVKISQNTEKSFGDLWRLAVTQPPMINHQLWLLWNNPKRE